MVDASDEELAAALSMGAVDWLLDEARKNEHYAAALEQLSQQPPHAAFWCFMLWFRVCGGGRDVRSALDEFISIFQSAAAKMEPASGGKAGRPTDEGVRLARVLKDAGQSRDEICGAVVPGFARLTLPEQRRAWRQLRERMRNQRKYEQRKGGDRAGSVRAGAAPEEAPGTRPRPRPVK